MQASRVVSRGGNIGCPPLHLHPSCRTPDKARHLKLKRTVALKVVLAGAERRNLHRRAVTTMAAMGNSRGNMVPRAIQDLEVFPQAMVLAELRARFADGNQHQKLALAFALARFGSTDVDFLVSQIPNASGNEADNIAIALDLSQKEARGALHLAAMASESKQDWRLKQRLSLMAMHLRDSSLAREMCRLRADPSQRTIFIDQTAASR